MFSSTIARGLLAALFLTLVPAPMLRAWEPLKTHPLNPRIMEFRGRPQLLYTVAEHYGSVVNADFDYIPYLNVMERDGMNLTRLFLAGFRHDNRVPANDPLAPTPAAFLQPWKRSTTGGNALDGLRKWDFNEWDDAYFSRLDDFMQQCSDRGIVVELTFFSTYYTEGEWRNSPFHPSNNVQGVGPVSRYDAIRDLDAGLTAAKEAYVRKIVREVNRFDNFYFEIHNEPFWNEPGVKDAQEVAFHTRMLEIIREEEAQLPNRHLVAHNFPQQMDAMSPDFEILNDHYPVAVPGTTLAGSEALLRDHYFRGKILAMGEGDTETEPQVRLETWMFLAGGGAIYNGLSFTNTIYTTDDEAGDNEFGNASRRSIRNAAKFMNALDLVSLRRDLTWVRSGIPTGATLQAMSNPGQQHVAYFHHGRGGLVNFQLAYNPIDDSDHQIAPVVRLEPGSWRATWTRPSDLTVLATEEFTHAGGDRTLGSVTYQADVVLRIDRTGEGDLTPPPPPSDLVATPRADGSIRLSWTPADAVDTAFHRIYRADSSGVSIDPSQLLETVAMPGVESIDLTTAVGATSHYLITAVDTNGNESPPSDAVNATALLENLPYDGTPFPVPGIIQIEDFDRGGQDIAYHDVTASNEGGQYRPTESVDIETTTDTGGGHHVFATQPGEWLEYTIHVAEAGVYRVDLRTSNPEAGGEVFFESNGNDPSGPVSVPQSTPEAPWQTAVVPELVLPAGVQVIRLTVTQAAGALNSMELTRVVRTGPTADAGPDRIIVDDNFDGFADALLDAGASMAGDAPISSYSWSLGAEQVATGASPTVSLPLGIHTLQLTATDANLLTSTDEVTIRVNPGGFYNGSFEEDFNGWTVTGNALMKSNPPYTFTDGGKLVAFNNDQSAPNGIVSQAFATIPGQTYRLTFDMGVLAFNDSLQQLQVQVVGSSSLLSQNFSIKRLNGALVTWESKTLQFVANSTSTTLTFRDLSTVTDSLDLTLDNIRVIQQISRTLVVKSSQAPGAAVTLSPPDSTGQGNGTASFTRIYPNAVLVTLTAAPTNAGASFSRWQKDGIDLGHSAVLNLLMDRDHTVTAIYVEGLPLITGQPVNTAVAAGATATFGVTATSSNPMTYQWRFNGVPITGEHSPTLQIPNVQTPNVGNYDVIVTSVVGSVTSATAALSIANTASLANGSFEAGLDGWTSSGNLSVQAGPPYTATAGTRLIAFNTGQRTPNGVLSQSFGTTPGQIYQLAFDMGVFAFNDSPQRLQVELTGSSSLFSQTFTTNRINGINMRWEARSVLFTANSGTTTLTFRDLSATSDSLDLTLDNIRIIPQITRTLTVQSSPSAGAAISVSPADSGGLSNGTTGFTRSYPNATSVNLTAASSNAGLTFSKWRKNGVDLATTAAISVVMDANHTLTAVYAEGLPVITSQPVGSAVAPGGTATFSVTASGSGTLAYQWRFNGANLTGEDEATLIIPDVQPEDAGSYDVIVSNTAGPVTSSAAVLSVPTAPVVGSLVNGSFESDFAGWTTTGNLSIRAGAPYAATDGVKQVAFNSAQLVPNAVLSQAFATTPGQIYQLAFDVGVLAYNDSPQRLQVELIGTSSLASQTFVTNRINGAAVRWDARTILFTANSTATTLVFRDLSTATDSLDLTLDNVRVIPQITRTLTVESTPSAGAAITVSPSDSGGLAGGSTGFTRAYPNATTVGLTAAAANGALSFSKWQKNGIDFATTRSISVVMDSNQTLTAVYVEGLPVITSQPSGTVVAPGGTATFNVTATASGPLAYQWRFDGNNLTDEDEATLVLTDVQPENAGSYDVIVSNAAGPVTSSAAVLTVPTAPVGASLVNGSFESDFLGWTTTGNLMIRAGNPYVATEGIKQVAFNSSQLAPNGVLSQGFSTTPGQSYQLAFDMGVVAYNDSPQRLQVELTGTDSLLSQTFTTNRLNGAVVRWEAKSLLFTANSPITILTFRDLSTVTDSLDLTLDNVRVISQVERTLTVQSSGAAGVAILASPADTGGLSNGTTSFIRTYPNSTTVNLSAPVLTGGFRFSKWQKNGVDLANTSSISLLMDGSHTLTAVYTPFTPGLPAGLKVMPLGDSITFGFTGTNAGYRGPLFPLLSPDAPGFQFVGTQTQFPGTLPSSPVDQRQHQGMPGYNIQDIANNLDGVDNTRFLALGGSDKNPAGGHWLTGGAGTGRPPLFPDVITLLIGTNDLQILTGAEGRLRNLIDKITTLRPAARLFVAKLTPNNLYPAENAAYNASVTSLVAEFKAAGKNIHLVDLNTGFPANGLDPDGFHPNSTGSSWMARQWRDAIVASYPAVDPEGPPVITDQPDSATVPAGGSVTFEVTAAGAIPLSYQWRRNSTPISGATSRTLTVANIQAGNTGAYDVVVSNSVATVTSSPAQLALLSSATVVNGSFESGLDGWTHTGNLQARSATAPYTATNGTRMIAFNHANLPSNGVLSQTVATTPGATYTLAFDLGVLAYNTSPQQMQVTGTGQTVVLSRTITLNGSGNGTTLWLPQSFTFVADSSSTVLSFRDTSTFTNGLDMLLDHVRMTVPAFLTAAPPDLESDSNEITTGTTGSGLPGQATLSGVPGDFRISFMAAGQGFYILQRSDDLVHWETIDDSSTEGPQLIEFRDFTPPGAVPEEPATQRFYRIGRQSDGIPE